MQLSPSATRALMGLKASLPKQEWVAVRAWLSTFYRYQLEWILDQWQVAITNKCRQNGASHSYAAWAVLNGFFGEDTTITSIGQNESSDVLEKVGKHCMALEAFGSGWAKTMPTATRIKMATGASIFAVPSTSGGRGKSGNVFLDEFAYHKDPERVWDGAAGSATHGYKIRIISTPNGVGDLFNHTWINADSLGYRRHLVTIDDARADGLKVDEDWCWRMARKDQRVYDQMFRGVFLDGDAQYIPSYLVSQSVVDDTYVYDSVQYAGLDIGKSVDLTALVVVSKDAYGSFWVQEVATCKRTSQEQIDAMIARAFQEYPHLKRICVDATGIGSFPAEALQKRFGRFKVEPVTFTMQSKEELATTMYQNFAESKVKMLAKEKELRDDVQSIRRIVTTAGNIRYDAPHTDSGHADRAWALALAIHAGTTKPMGKRIIAPSTEYELDQ